MTDAIIRTSGDYALNLNKETAIVTARTYHLARATAHADAVASLTLLPGRWIAAATQTDSTSCPSAALQTLVQHVAELHRPLRVANDGHVPRILKGIVRVAGAGDVSYGPPEARDRDIAHHRTR